MNRTKAKPNVASLLAGAAMPTDPSAKLPPSHTPNPDNPTMLSLEQQEQIKGFSSPNFHRPITERIGDNVIVFTMPAFQWLTVALITGKNDPQAVACAKIVSDRPDLLDEFGYVTLQRTTDFKRKRLVWTVPSKSTIKELRKRRTREAEIRAKQTG